MTTTRPTSRARRTTRALAVGLSLGLAAGVVTASPAQAVLTTPVANPDLSASCGLDVVVALDASFSIDTGVEVRAAATSIIAPFTDTTTRVGIVTFANTATTRLPLTLVTTDSVKPTGAHGAAIAAIRLADGTNWQDAILKSNALFAASPRSGAGKLLIMVSDGEPRNYNLPDGSPSPKLGTSNDERALNPAITAANTFKNSGGHVLSLGVQVTEADTIPYENLKLISDPAGQFAPATAFDAETTDVAVAANFTAVGTQIANAVTQLCAGSLTVTERATSKSAPTTYGNGGSGWGVTATVSPSGNYIKPVVSSAATVATTTDAGGNALFQWTPPTNPWSKSLSFTTGAKTNYKLGGVSCKRNGVAIATTLSGRTVTIPGGVSGTTAVTCTVNNIWTGPLASNVTLTPSKKNVVYTASTIKLRGKLASPLAPLAGQKVKIQSKYPTSSAWKTIKKTTTSSKGTFSMKVTPKRTTQYRATYAGKSTARAQYAGTSAVATVNVGTAVYLKLSKSSVKKGATVTFSGRVAPKKKGTVLLQRLVGKNWVTVTSGKLTSKSTYSIKYTTTSTVDYRWRIYKGADKKNSFGVSGGVVLRVS
jgi:Mg-chelatase subunit ChlD